MKRLAVLCIVLLALTSLAFAEVKVEPKVTLAASGTLTWGIDLSTFDTGFLNSADADLTVTFIAADTAETKKGDGAAYGEIKISDIELVLGGDDLFNDTADHLLAWLSDWVVDGDVAAKIVIPPIEIGLFAAPTMYIDALGEIEVDANDDNIVDIETVSGTGGADGIYYAGGGGLAVQPFTFTATYGTWVKATLGPFTGTVKIVSDGDWTSTRGDTGYALGFDGSLAIAPLTVTFGGYGKLDAYYGFYGKLAATVGPLAFWAGLEGNLVGADPFAFVTGGNATLTIAEGTTLAVTALYGAPINGLDLKVAFVEPEAGLIPGADIALTFFLLDVGETNADMNGMEYEGIATVGYKVKMGDVNYVRPYGTFKYGMGNDDPTFMPYMYAEAGVQLQLIPLTLFTVKYVSGDLAPDDSLQTADTGSVQFVATVTY